CPLYRFDPSLRLEEGEALQVLGRFKPKSDAIVVCEQVLIVKATQQIVAQALVTLACIGAVDGKLRGVPSKALETLCVVVSRMSASPHKTPVRAIYNETDLAAFHKSKTYADFLAFVRLCNERVRGIPVSEEYPHKDGPAVGALVAYLEEAWGWVDDIPPLQQVRKRGERGGEERKTGGRQGAGGEG
ncbi:phosphotyrosyl phosphatase activator family protein, partial [Nannochloropsis oceanica]